LDPSTNGGDFASALEALGEAIERAQHPTREFQAFIKQFESANGEQPDSPEQIVEAA
jgi:hypothetical protein